MGRWRVFMGFLAGAAFIVFAHVGSEERLFLGLGIAFLGLLLRGWAAGYLEKGKRLAQDGPYALFRHPLYAGSFLLAVGFCLAGTGAGHIFHDMLLWAIVILLFFGVYPRRIREEEATLGKYFGDAWQQFTARNFRFFPNMPKKRREGADPFRWSQYFKNHEHNALVGYLFGALVLGVKFKLGW